MHVLIIKYILSCTIRRIDGKPVIYILVESVESLKYVVYKHSILFMSNFSVKDGLYLINFNSGKWELLNSYNNLPESLIFNIKYQYNSSSSEQIPRQGNNQQGHKLINHLSDQKHDIILIPFYGKYIQFNREFIEWFIGFTEGDGSFNIKKGRSYFTIHLHNVDLPLLYKIKSELNMGIHI